MTLLPEIDVEQLGYFVKLHKETNFTPNEISEIVNALFELKESIKTRRSK
jgi:hypothetical protein